MTALIPRNSLAWLLIAQLVVLVPHLPRLPWWIAVLWLGCALWRVQIQRMRWGYPGRLLRAGGLLLTGLAVYLSQGTLIGLDLGAARPHWLGNLAARAGAVGAGVPRLARGSVLGCGEPAALAPATVNAQVRGAKPRQDYGAPRLKSPASSLP